MLVFDIISDFQVTHAECVVGDTLPQSGKYQAISQSARKDVHLFVWLSNCSIYPSAWVSSAKYGSVHDSRYCIRCILDKRNSTLPTLALSVLFAVFGRQKWELHCRARSVRCQVALDVSPRQVRRDQADEKRDCLDLTGYRAFLRQ